MTIVLVWLTKALSNVTVQLSKFAGYNCILPAPFGTAISIPIVPWNEPVMTAGTGFKTLDKVS
jgi:hypothetical protein